MNGTTVSDSQSGIAGHGTYYSILIGVVCTSCSYNQACFMSQSPLLPDCDDRKGLPSGDRHVHGPSLNSSGQDEDSLVFTSVPVPSELTVKQSSIPGAGLGVFAKTLLHQEIWFGPYKGRTILRDAIRSDADTSYMWEVRAVTLIQS